MGLVHCKDYELTKVNARRVPLDQVERELNRFHDSLSQSRQQLEDLKGRLRGMVPADHVRILDTHVAYLKDSVFLSDVENLILNEQMSLEGAIAKVILDFDRIFRLVENEVLRERAVDLRDVGIRVLRNLERSEQAEPDPVEQSDYILVARELSIVDMFNLHGEHVLGILTEAGSLTSHAAILARSMRIPTLTGIEGLRDAIGEDDFVIVDATEGVVRARPDEVVRAQYRQAREEQRATTTALPDWAGVPTRTADDQEVVVSATCGNLPEVERAVTLEMKGIGLYRTELLFLIDRALPSLDSLVAHYRSVLEEAAPRPVTFRLLDADSSLELGYLHSEREQNPGLGRFGVRALLAHEQVLRRQLQALLCAGGGLDAERSVRIAVPKVVDCGELRRIREILFEERFALRKAGVEHLEEVEVGVVIETPASVLGIVDLAAESDFLLIGFDSLQQYLLAADRENSDLAEYFESVHPFVLRSLKQVVDASIDARKPLSIFGVTASSPANLALLIGIGLRHFGIAPVAMRGFLASLESVNAHDATRAADLASRVACPTELRPVSPG
jgi:phosphoenolpyruvate-protein phosphotransferase